MQTVRGNNIELTTIHPAWGDMEIDDVHALVGHGMRMTPHVGNLDKIVDSELDQGVHFIGAHATAPPSERTRNNVALALMGVRVECADTIALNDDSARPYVVLKDERETPLTDMSIVERETHVPRAVNAQGSDKNVQDIHMEALKAIVPGAMTRTEFYDQLGVQHGYGRGEIYQALMVAVNGMVRVAHGGKVSGNSAQKVHSDEVNKHGIFGSGEDPLSGIMPTVEMAIAAELVEAAIEGRDELHHIGGMDMEDYTKRPQFMEKVVAIAERALAGAGAQAPKRLIYTVVNKYHGVAGLTDLSKQIGTAIGLERYSQHDLQANPDALEDALSLAT